MAKCIQSTKNGSVKRVSNDEAFNEVKSGKCKYISKSDYKRVLIAKSNEGRK
jgi:hypothetical protein